MSRPSVLQARGIRVRRGGAQVLEVPSLDLRAGEVLALMGPNGAGKSTLMLTLAGLLQPAEGTLHFHGTDLSARAEREVFRRRITMVFQDPLLFDATVAENIATGLRLRGLPKSERLPRVQEWAGRLGLGNLLDRSAKHLSGGEAQRTALARAFVLQPEILFLDEPFSSLDAPTREELIGDLGRLLAETETTAVIATHDQGKAARLAHRLAVMREGRIVQLGGLREVMNHPEDPFVASFMGMETLLKGQVVTCQDGLVSLRLRKVLGDREVQAIGEAQPGQTVLIGVRPEHVALSLQTDISSSVRNAFPGAVTKVIPRGPFYKIELDCGFFLTAFVTAQSLSELELQPGRAVVASFKATAVHLIRKEGLEPEV
ncbi:ABC transporter ATP-binding protein [Geothrix sp. PMB-07]|uniref:ABC transporter ATP-binding protein n=1 Tax=Geothrix sp. PMB-07 TaxID=3068640 RepID=UPI0027421135|nr:ABC transporter ATP-binding protein [Geothrix sp. PMB-07]WLT32159.1 ABC transporter ATP-binding protein [Geothrix sp. PMB-07]